MMMQHNCCTFAKIIDGRMNSQGEKCGLYFRTNNELVHHIEEEHIPLIESSKMAEKKQLKEQFGNDPEQYEKACATFLNQPIPLSLICKLKPFPKGYKVQPIPPPKQRTMKFCHYKPKVQPPQQQAYSPAEFTMKEFGCTDLASQSLMATATKKLIHSENRVRKTTTSSERATPEVVSNSLEQQTVMIPEEKRNRCLICGKTYKNQQGLRQHMRTAHNASIENNTLVSTTKLSASEESILSRQLPGRQSPFVAVRAEQGKTHEIVGNLLATNTSRSAENKLQCQHCSKEFKGYKAASNLNKHLLEAHSVIPASHSPSYHSANFSSSSPLGSVKQQIYSPQQSPQRPISAGNSITILSAQPHQQAALQAQNSFVAPTLTARHHQLPPPQQAARPSAPIPSSKSGAISQPLAYSPAPHQQSAFIQQPADHGQQIQPGQPNYYVTAIEQQPPVLQPQQQQQTSQRHRYTYQQPQLIQRQQQQEQQATHIYSSGPGTGTYIYPSPTGQQQQHQQQMPGGTTTIYVTHNQQQANQGMAQQQQQFGVQQQMEYAEQQPQDSYGRSYYRQQPSHYMVEAVQGQPQPIYAQSPPSNARLVPTSSIRVSTGNSQQQQQQYMQQQPQQQQCAIPQQAQQFQGVYAQPRASNAYQGESPHHHSSHPQQQQQQPFIATIRTAPIQGAQQQQQRIYQQQQQQSPAHHQYYTHQQRPQSHSQQQTQRQSPATVAAVLAAASPHQGSNSPNMYAIQQQGQQQIGYMQQQQ